MGKKRKNIKHVSKGTINLKTEIISILQKKHKSSFSAKDLATKIGVNTPEGKLLVQKHIDALIASGTIVETQKNKVRIQTTGGYITGVVDLTAYGTAYVVSPDLQDDVFISAANLNRALNGDTVKVYLFAQKSGKRPEGEVVEIIAQGRRDFVGIIEKNSRYSFVVVDKKHIPFDIFVANEDTQNAHDGQKVIVTITDWPKRAKNPIGKITQVLGNVGDNETEMHAILAEFGLPYSFPKEVNKYADKIESTIPPATKEPRKDFRGITTFTIDPVDAKDFDDALSIEFIDDNTYKIGVHIADVTHYVQKDDPIDKEAQQRATSVYLVDRTIPMLPEKLSNDICSLRPNEDRLAFSAVFTCTNEAEIKEQWFGKTIIRSCHRFSYNEAQEIIESADGIYSKELAAMNSIAQKLRAARFESGAIAFDKKEVKFTIDTDGTPTGVYYTESKEAHKLIEEFMLLANRKVSEYINAQKYVPTFIYRIHDKPDEFKLTEFSNFIKKFGFKISTSGGNATAKSINKLLAEVKDNKERNVFENLAVRAMAKAVYSTDNIGHYGLAFDYYSHFTSPIRRYPDMMAHRLLYNLLQHKSSAPKDEYEELCKHSSAREQLASQAERASIKYKQVEFMKNHIGEEFDGVVSGITEWGLYVELKDNLCEGLVPIRDLHDDQYVFDERNYCLRGRFHNKTYTLGDELRIKIVRADLAKRQLDFTLADAPPLSNTNK